MLNKQICIHCHETYMREQCLIEHKVCSPDTHKWKEYDEEHWKDEKWPHVVCWSGSTSIHKPPPEWCPFQLEHLLKNAE